ncbi:hypothetical protein CHS0354_003039 [Potamilus streckersoni]|uniref:Uncharacterized protein n=1 Tax=Potamilus streckersoni TaxID=2493646 RepID=A0AAE0W9U5_9BIVA|nr:hypothetical protein CHS0354_003039 [Potamilus streckersoni]
MESVITICVFLVMFGTGQTNDFKLRIYSHGDNATVLIEKLQNDERKILDIYFNGFTKKLHYYHVMLIGPNTNNDKHISRTYAGRINNIKLENDSLSFLLLNVNFMDSGNYTVFDSSWEKGKQSIVVPRSVECNECSTHVKCDTNPQYVDGLQDITNHLYLERQGTARFPNQHMMISIYS